MIDSMERIITGKFLAVLVKTLSDTISVDSLIETLKIIRESISSTYLKETLSSLNYFKQFISLGPLLLSYEIVDSQISIIIKEMKTYLDISKQERQLVELAESLDINNSDSIQAYYNAIMNAILLFSEYQVKTDASLLIISKLTQTLSVSINSYPLNLAQILLIRKTIRADNSLKLLESGIVEVLASKLLCNAELCRNDLQMTRVILDTIYNLTEGNDTHTAIDNKTIEEAPPNVFIKLNTEHLMRNILDLIKFVMKNKQHKCPSLTTALNTRAETTKDTYNEEEDVKGWISLLNIALSILINISLHNNHIKSEMLQKQGPETISKCFRFINENQDPLEHAQEGIVLTIKLLKYFAWNANSDDQLLNKFVMNSLLGSLGYVHKFSTEPNESNESLLIIEDLDLISTLNKSVFIKNVEKGKEYMKTLLEALQRFTITGTINNFTSQVVTKLLKILHSFVEDPLFLLILTHFQGDQIIVNILRQLTDNIDSTRTVIEPIKPIMMLDQASSKSYSDKAIEETLSILSSITINKRIARNILFLNKDHSIIEYVLAICNAKSSGPKITLLSLKICQRYLNIVQKHSELKIQKQIFDAMNCLTRRLFERYNNVELITQSINLVESMIKATEDSIVDRPEVKEEGAREEKVNSVIETCKKMLNSEQDVEFVELAKDKFKEFDIIMELLYVAKELIPSQGINNNRSVKGNSEILQEVTNVLLRLLNRHRPITIDLIQESNILSYIIPIIQNHNTPNSLRRKVLLIAQKVIDNKSYIKQPKDFLEALNQIILAYINWSTDNLMRSLVEPDEIENIDITIQLLGSLLPRHDSQKSYEELKLIFIGLAELMEAAVANHKLLHSTIECLCIMLDKNKELAKLLIDTEAAFTLVVHFETFEDDVKLVQAFAKFIARSAISNEQLHTMYIENNVLEYLLQTGSKNDCSAETNLEICSAYSSLLSIGEQDEVQAIKMEVSRFIVELANRLYFEPLTTLEMLKLVTLLTHNDEEITRHLNEQKVPEWLMSSLTKYMLARHDEGILQTMKTVNNLLNDKMAVKRFIQLDLTELVIRSLNTNNNRIESTLMALTLLKSIFSNIEKEDLATINRLGVIETLVQ